MKKTVDKNPVINTVLEHTDEFPQNSIASSPLFLSEQAPLSSPLLYGTACTSHYSPGLICPGPTPESRGSQVNTVPSVVLTVNGFKTPGIHDRNKVEGDKVPAGNEMLSLIQRQHVDIEKRRESWHLRVSSAGRAIC